MKMNNIDEMFEEKKLKVALRKIKIKNIVKIIIVSTLVFFIGTSLHNYIMTNLSKKAYERTSKEIELSIPKGYISKYNDSNGLLGGYGRYKVSKIVDNRAIYLEERLCFYGIRPPMNMSAMRGNGEINRADEFPTILWENGYEKMIFFHPEIKYEKYKDDLSKIDKIQNGKVIEMGISFDKPYDIEELYNNLDTFKGVNITWLWIDSYTKESLEMVKEEKYIDEGNVIGFSYRDNPIQMIVFFKDLYDEWFKSLNANGEKSKTKSIYENMIKEGKNNYKEGKILGIIVEGKKESLKTLKNNPMIKASSFGVIIDEIY